MQTESHRWMRGWASDSALLLTSQVLTIVATSVAAILIARALAPDDWAVFSAFLGLSLALALVADFGIGTWLLRELSRAFSTGADPSRHVGAGELVTSGLAVNVALATPLLVVAVTWTLVAQAGLSTSIALLCLLLYGALMAGANALEAHLRARRRVRIVLVASILEKLLLVIGVVGVHVSGAGLAAVGVVYLAAGVIRVAFDVVVLFLRHRVPFVVPSAAALLATARSSAPFALNTGAMNLIPRLDTFVLILLSTTSAAWFAIGDRVLGPALLIPAVLGSTLYPFMASSARQTSSVRVAAALGAAGLALAGAGALLAPVLIPGLFGNAYRESVPVAQIMLLALPFVFASSTLLVVAYSHGRERSLLAPVVGISLAGTAAIALGQVLGGPSLAAGGFVLRQVLFLTAIGIIALRILRRVSADGERASEAPHQEALEVQ